jgi:excisionase family DNA binding protein
MEAMNLRDLLTVEAAAAEYGFSKTWITRLLNAGRLQGVRINGRAWMVSKKDLARYSKTKQPVGRPAKPTPSAKPRQSKVAQSKKRKTTA